MKRFCIHPGFVVSANDGDRHYISYPKLIELYGVNPKDCAQFRANSAIHMGKTCLRPSSSGRYRLQNT